MRACNCLLSYSYAANPSRSPLRSWPINVPYRLTKAVSIPMGTPEGCLERRLGIARGDGTVLRIAQEGGTQGGSPPKAHTIRTFSAQRVFNTSAKYDWNRQIVSLTRRSLKLRLTPQNIG